MKFLSRHDLMITLKSLIDALLFDKFPDTVSDAIGASAPIESTPQECTNVIESRPPAPLVPRHILQ